MMELHSVLILVVILAIIFFLTYFINIRQKRLVKKISEKQEPRFDIENKIPESTHSNEHIEEYDEEENTHQNSVNLLLDDPLLQPTPKPQPKKNNEPMSAKKVKSAAEEILYLMLVAKPNKPYVGYELLQALLAGGLRFGAMNIFHRHEDLNGNGKILFSVASASEPGTFEINKMGAYSGKGLMLFMRLSNNKDLMHAFDLMIETAKQLIEDLDGDMIDDEQKILTNEKIEKLKKKISEFEQNQLIGDLFDE